MSSNEFILGSEFSSLKEVKKAIKNYESKNFVNLWVRNSRKIKSVRTKTPARPSIKEELVFSEIDYACSHGGRKYVPQSTGARPKRTLKTNCPFKIILRLSNDGQKLFVRSMCNEHNHVLHDEKSFKLTAKQRRLPKEIQVEAERLMKGAYNRKAVQKYVEHLTGKTILRKDLNNLAMKIQRQNVKRLNMPPLGRITKTSKPESQKEKGLDMPEQLTETSKPESQNVKRFDMPEHKTESSKPEGTVQNVVLNHTIEFGTMPRTVAETFLEALKKNTSMTACIHHVLSIAPLLHRKYTFMKPNCPADTIMLVATVATTDNHTDLLKELNRLDEFVKDNHYDSRASAIEELLFSPVQNEIAWIRSDIISRCPTCGTAVEKTEGGVLTDTKVERGQTNGISQKILSTAQSTVRLPELDSNSPILPVLCTPNGVKMDGDISNFQDNSETWMFCQSCNIVFLDKTVYRKHVKECESNNPKADLVMQKESGHQVVLSDDPDRSAVEVSCPNTGKLTFYQPQEDDVGTDSDDENVVCEFSEDDTEGDLDPNDTKQEFAEDDVMANFNVDDAKVVADKSGLSMIPIKTEMVRFITDTSDVAGRTNVALDVIGLGKFGERSKNTQADKIAICAGDSRADFSWNEDLGSSMATTSNIRGENGRGKTLGKHKRLANTVSELTTTRALESKIIKIEDGELSDAVYLNDDSIGLEVEVNFS